MYLEDEEYSDGWLPPGLTLIKKVDGDADSLFETLIQCIEEEVGNNTKFEAKQLRQELVEELLKNPLKYNVKLHKSLKKSLRSMKNPGNMPSLEILLVFSALFKCQVWLHVGSERPIIFDYSEGSTLSNFPKIHIQMLGGIHFNPLRECGSRYNPPIMDIARQKWKHFNHLSE